MHEPKDPGAQQQLPPEILTGLDDVIGTCVDVEQGSISVETKRGGKVLTNHLHQRRDVDQCDRAALRSSTVPDPLALERRSDDGDVVSLIPIAVLVERDPIDLLVAHRRVTRRLRIDDHPVALTRAQLSRQKDVGLACAAMPGGIEPEEMEGVADRDLEVIR